MTDAYETFEHHGVTVEIHADDAVFDPRKEWDHLGRMVCWHRCYDLGDESPADLGHDFPSAAVMYRWLRRYAAVVLPLGLIDHSGLSMYVGDGPHPMDPGGWDSGLVGFIYMTRETVAENWPDDPDALRRAEDCLRAEVTEYDQYLTGDVWGYVVAPDSDDEESCWGFYGLDYARSEAREAAEHVAAERAARPLQLALLPMEVTA